MKYFICEHINEPAPKERHNILSLSKPGSKMLACEECFKSEFALTYEVEQRFFDSLEYVCSQMSRKQPVN